MVEVFEAVQLAFANSLEIAIFLLVEDKEFYMLQLPPRSVAICSSLVEFVQLEFD